MKTDPRQTVLKNFRTVETKKKKEEEEDFTKKNISSIKDEKSEQLWIFQIPVGSDEAMLSDSETFLPTETLIPNQISNKAWR